MTVYEFGDWIVEADLGRIRRGDEQKHLEPKALAVLTCLLDHPGEVLGHEFLMKTVWNGRIVEASALPRNIALLRRALGDDARRPQYIETIPKLGYRALAPVHAQPHGAESHPSRPLANGTAPVLAVLPFDNLSPEPELRYFSDGISEEVLHAVARARGLQVIGRSSSFQFRGKDKTIRKVARELGCTHVLDGSVRRSGDRVRVSAQLIECVGQTVLWADSFEHGLADVFALQDEVATQVARALEVAFSGPRNTRPVDPIAFDLYLRAKASSTQWLGACDADLLDQALARVPDFAPAGSALAVTRAIEAYLERDPARSEPLRTKALVAAGRALQLDPTAASAYAAQSILEPVCGRYEERDGLITNALQAAPNDTVSLFWSCRWSWAVGRHREGLATITRACQVDPLWAQGLHQYASMLLMVGLYDDAFCLWDDLNERWPDRYYLRGVPLLFAASFSDWKRVDLMLARLDASGLETSQTRMVRKRVERFRRWDAQETKALARELTEEVERTGTIRFYLQWACQLGLTDHVYALVERASFAHLFEPWGRSHEIDFGLHALFWRGDGTLHNDPRFVPLCARLGLCDYWVNTGRWPDCADQVSDHYDFRAEAVRYVREGRAPTPSKT